MTAPPSIVDFLKERLTEDRQRVLSVGPSKLAWGTYLHPDGGMGYTSPVASRGLSEDEWVTAGKVTHPDLVAVVFDPEVRLADIDSKLRLIDTVMAWEHQLLYTGCDENVGPFPCSREGTECDPVMCGVGEKQDQVLRALAAEFAGHEDYQKEAWAL